jgi:hypothetical protein
MGINVPNPNRTAETVADQKLISGLTRHATAIPSIVLAGASVTTKDIVATLQSRIDMASAASSARATWLAAVQADRALRERTKTYVSGLRQALLVAFAGQVDTLADFGLTGPKPRVVTPEEKVAAAAKARATREARHTMGKKQKAGIKGTVASAAPAPAAPTAPTPAPAAPTALTPAPAAPTAPTPAPTPPAAPASPATPAAPTSTHAA